MWNWGKTYTIWTSSITSLVVLDKMKIIEPNTLSPSFQFFFFLSVLPQYKKCNETCRDISYLINLVLVVFF